MELDFFPGSVLSKSSPTEEIDSSTLFGAFKKSNNNNALSINITANLDTSSNSNTVTISGSAAQGTQPNANFLSAMNLPSDRRASFRGSDVANVLGVRSRKGSINMGNTDNSSSNLTIDNAFSYLENPKSPFAARNGNRSPGNLLLTPAPPSSDMSKRGSLTKPISLNAVGSPSVTPSGRRGTLLMSPQFSTKYASFLGNENGEEERNIKHSKSSEYQSLSANKRASVGKFNLNATQNKQGMKYNANIVNVIKKFWKMLTKITGSNGVVYVSREEFFNLLCLMFMCLIEGISKEDMEKDASRDCDIEIGSEEGLPWSSLHKTLFELADHWTTSGDVDEYTTFLTRLLADVSLETGETVDDEPQRKLRTIDEFKKYRAKKRRMSIKGGRFGSNLKSVSENNGEENSDSDQGSNFSEEEIIDENGIPIKQKQGKRGSISNASNSVNLLYNRESKDGARFSQDDISNDELLSKIFSSDTYFHKASLSFSLFQQGQELVNEDEIDDENRAALLGSNSKLNDELNTSSRVMTARPLSVRQQLSQKERFEQDLERWLSKRAGSPRTLATVGKIEIDDWDVEMEESFDYYMNKYSDANLFPGISPRAPKKLLSRVVPETRASEPTYSEKLQFLKSLPYLAETSQRELRIRDINPYEWTDVTKSYDAKSLKVDSSLIFVSGEGVSPRTSSNFEPSSLTRSDTNSPSLKLLSPNYERIFGVDHIKEILHATPFAEQQSPPKSARSLARKHYSNKIITGSNFSASPDALKVRQRLVESQEANLEAKFHRLNLTPSPTRNSPIPFIDSINSNAEPGFFPVINVPSINSSVRSKTPLYPPPAFYSSKSKGSVLDKFGESKDSRPNSSNRKERISLYGEKKSKGTGLVDSALFSNDLLQPELPFLIPANAPKVTTFRTLLPRSDAQSSEEISQPSSICENNATSNDLSCLSSRRITPNSQQRPLNLSPVVIRPATSFGGSLRVSPFSRPPKIKPMKKIDSPFLDSCLSINFRPVRIDSKR